MLLTDFKTAFGKVKRHNLLEDMVKIHIPSKLIELTKWKPIDDRAKEDQRKRRVDQMTENIRTMKISD